jgi:SWI/SNF-related matrix-associated actin-dependent regulator of chromatin subfamily A3
VEARPKKKQRRGKEPLAAAAPAASAAASSGKAAGKGGGGSKGDKLAAEAAERAMAQEGPALPPAANGPRATLIVCPLPVVSNWEMQIQEHTSGGLSGGLSGTGASRCAG